MCPKNNIKAKPSESWVLLFIANTNNTEKSITYDNLGDITGLERYLAGTKVDGLKYDYSNGGNGTTRLYSITDSTSSDNGLKHGTFTYAYDGNGNMTTDNSKGLTITYNMLNLPQTNTLAAGTITYTYDANGRKLRKVSTVGSGTTTDYIDGIQYTNGTIDFIQNEEGRVLTPTGTPNYEYTLTDNLGNNRRTFDSSGGAGTAKQADDYLPFGMEISTIAPSNKNNYLYNNKELQEGLGVYDYDARLYDPVIGRWTSVDPLAEKSRRFSPYTYGDDNSIRNIDPDGMETQGCCDVVKPFLDATELVTKQIVKGAIGVAGVASKLLDGENSHRAFSKDPAVRAEANKELKSDVTELVIAAMTAEVGGRLLGMASEGFNGTGPTVEITNPSKMLDIPGGPKTGSAGGPGAGLRFSNKTKIEANTEANGNCVLCGEKTDTGAPGKKGNTDHAIPKSRGGNNTLKNAQHTCANCNQILKKTKTTEEYLNQRSN